MTENDRALFFIEYSTHEMIELLKMVAVNIETL